jgi:PAS domain S-box-containing protein
VWVSQIEVPNPRAAQKRIIMIETGRGFMPASGRSGFSLPACEKLAKLQQEQAMDSDPRDVEPVDSAVEIDGQPDFIPIFAELIRNREDWLMDRILSYAKRQGYARYTSTLKEAWRLSISGLSTSMQETFDKLPDLELGPDEDFLRDPAAAFGLIEAKRHRERGISLPVFLGLMKYYRQSYQDLIEASELPAAARARARVWVDRFFDRVEIALCNAWTTSTDEKREDLTERKKIAEELARKERFLKGILDAIQDGISVLDADLNILRVNEAMKGIYTAEASLEGKKCFEAYFGRSQPCDKCPTLRTLKSGRLESEEIVLRRQDKPPVYLEVFAFPMLDDQGRLMGVVDYVRNVTARKQAEQALQEQNRQYRDLFETCQLPILLIDPQTGAVVEGNSEACRFYGYPHEKLTRLNITDINMLSREAVLHEMRRAQTRRRNSFSFRHRLSSGEVREVEVFSGPIIFEQQSLLCSFVLDVTERKILDEERLQREKLEAVLEIAGAVCHELNQPLMALSGYHELIRFNLDEQSTANKYLVKAHKQTRRMGDITGRLMCITRYETRDYAGGMKILDIEKSAGNPGSGSDSDD